LVVVVVYFFLNNMIEFKYQSWFEYFIEFI
jgi:hypothetical protein